MKHEANTEMYNCIVNCYRQCMFDAVLKSYSSCEAIVADKENDSFYLYDIHYKFVYSGTYDDDDHSLNVTCNVDCTEPDKFYKLQPKYQEDSKKILDYIIEQGKIISEKMLKAIKETVNGTVSESDSSTKN